MTGERVDFLDGVVFSADEAYLTLGALGRTRRRRSATTPASRSTTGRSSRRRPTAHRARLPVALGHRLVLVLPGVRRAEPAGPPALAEALAAQRRLLGLVGFENRHHVGGDVGRAARTPGPRAGGPGRRDPARAHRRVPRLVPARGADRAGLAVPAAALREHGADEPPRWPLYPLQPGATYVNVGFWSTVPIEPGRRGRRRQPPHRAEVADLGGHKSLYSDAYYDEDEFWPPVRRRRPTPGQEALRPGRPAARPLREGGEAAMTLIDRTRPSTSCSGPDVPLRFAAYDGLRWADPTPPFTLRPDQRARAALPRHRPGRPRPGPRLRPGRPRHRGRPPGRPLRRCCKLSRTRSRSGARTPRDAARAGADARAATAPAAGAAAQETPPQWLTARRAAAHPRPATPRRSTTTTTCPTRSTSWSSGRR